MRWQSQHLTLKKKPTQQRHYTKLKNLRLKKTTLLMTAFTAAYNLYNSSGRKSSQQWVDHPQGLKSKLKLNWSNSLASVAMKSLLPELSTNPVNVRLKNAYNWFTDKPYLFLNTRPERPTKEAFLTQSLLFTSFLQFKKVIRKGVLQQKPKPTYGKPTFRLTNNLNLLTVTLNRNLTHASSKTLGISAKFQMLFNNQRLWLQNRNAQSYKAAHSYDTSYLNTGALQRNVNTEQYNISSIRNLTWWSHLTHLLYNRNKRVVKTYSKFKKWNSHLQYNFAMRPIKFRTREHRTNLAWVDKKSRPMRKRLQKLLLGTVITPLLLGLTRQVSRRAHKSFRVSMCTAIIYRIYNRMFCKGKLFKITRSHPRKFLKGNPFIAFIKRRHLKVKKYFGTTLPMAKLIYPNHPNILAAQILRFLTNSRLTVLGTNHAGTVQTLKQYDQHIRHSYNNLRTSIQSTPPKEVHKRKKGSKKKKKSRLQFKRLQLNTYYDSMWILKKSHNYIDHSLCSLTKSKKTKPYDTSICSVSRYYPTLTANVYNTFRPLNSEQKVTPSTKLHLVSLYNIPFILKSYAFIYTNTPNLNNSRSLVHNSFPLFKYRRYVHSFLYQNEVKRYILKRHRSARPHFGHELTNEFFDNVRTFKDYVYRYRRVHLNNLVAPSPQSYFNTPDDRSLYTPMHETVKIKRVRFKPGYYRLWRNARTALKESLNLTFRYQHRLTSYLPRFYKLSKFQTLHAIETRLTSILIYTNLIPDYEFSKYFIDNNLVYVNGIVANQYNEVIVLHDFIQLVISLKFYIADRWLTNWKLKKQLRLKKLANAKYNNQSFRLDKQSSNKLPKWIYTNKYRFYDVPNYLEVDYFTLSAFTIYDPFLISDFNPVNSREFRVSIYKNYNWKYIT